MIAAWLSAALGQPSPPATRPTTDQPADHRAPRPALHLEAEVAVGGHGGTVAGESAKTSTTTGAMRCSE